MEMMAGDFSAKTRQIDFTRVDARGGDRIPRDNRNTANTAHKSPGEKIQTQRILCQNNTMGDHGNAVNTGHNLSPWRGWIDDPRIKYWFWMKYSVTKEEGGENTWLTEF